MHRDFEKFARSRGVSSLTLHNYKTKAMTPYIIEERQLNIAQMDVFSRLMMDKTIFLGTEINDVIANVIQAQLLYLESTTKKSEDITLLINSPGGEIHAGLGIYDTMNYIQNDVATMCTSVAASMAAVLLSAGTKGKRRALPNSMVMIHQASTGTWGKLTDVRINVALADKLESKLYDILAETTGTDVDKVRQDCLSDFWRDAEEAKEYGLIDSIITKK